MRQSYQLLRKLANSKMARRKARASGAASASADDESVGSVDTKSHNRHRSKKRKRAEETVIIEDDPDVFEIKEAPPEAGGSYHAWCVYGLTKEFPKVALSSVKQVLRLNLQRFGPAYRTLYQVEHKTMEAPGWLRFTKSKTNIPTPEPCPFFEKEFELVKAKLPPIIDIIDLSQEIECGCCFVDYPFEQMVQCADGHLFCLTCLQRHVEQATFGGGQSFSLPCMDTSGCTEFFPWSEVERTLPPEILQKFERRVAEESVARAKLEGLVYCPFCSFPCEVDQGLRNLDCPSCHKLSCVHCKEPDHLPLSCEEVEKKTETSIRRHIEEVMTKALIRECGSCKAELVKQDGCNKVTCRCGKVICYVCRGTIQEAYAHFCQHPREPGKPCTACDKCGLWDKEESDAIVKEAKKAAMKEAALKEPNITKRKIGPDELQPHKKHKRS